MAIRTCLVTGKKGDPRDFFRFTVQKGILVFDKSLKIKNEGRGGYVEKTVKSLEKLKFLRKKIQHFLKCEKVVIEEKIIEEQKRGVVE